MIQIKGKFASTDTAKHQNSYISEDELTTWEIELSQEMVASQEMGGFAGNEGFSENGGFVGNGGFSGNGDFLTQNVSGK